MKVHLDFETRSAVDLTKTGVHIYAVDPTTDVWCACYSIGDGPVQTWVPGQPPPQFPPDVEIHAWNAQFERVIWREVMVPVYGWPALPDEAFHCTMCAAYAMGLPGKLDQAAVALRAKIGKDSEGYSLMLRMCRPRKVMDDGTLVWWDDPERIARLVAYCARDVEVERLIGKALLPLSKPERSIYLLDQKMNDRGVHVDVPLVTTGIAIATEAKARLTKQMRKVTKGLATCSQPAKIIEFVQQLGVEMDSVAKAKLAEQLDEPDNYDELPELARTVLQLRREYAKTSVEKLPTLLAGTGHDNRIRGLLQYHGASTGRWSGRRFQPQNLMRPVMKLKAILLAIDVIMSMSADPRDLRPLEFMFGSPMAVLADVVRSTLTATPGHRLMSADYSNIEGRVLAWLAGEEWKVKAFADFDAGQGHDLYKLAYARSFGIDPTDVTDVLRQIGKVMELALGFQGGVGAFQTMAKNYGVKVSDERADELKVGWREAHPMTQQFWYDLEEAAFLAVLHPGRQYRVGAVTFLVSNNWLMLKLPSGRKLYYREPHIRAKKTPWGEMKDQVHYWGMNSYTRHWELCSAYGGLWTENIVQATARDIMAVAMLRLDAAGYNLILTVHDEIIVDQPANDDRSLSEMVAIMKTGPRWADGLPTAVAGWEGERYRKG